MKRTEIVAVAKMLGIKATGKNEELLVKIQEKLDSWSKPEPVPSRMARGVRRLPDRKPEDGRKGLHPITGEVIY